MNLVLVYILFCFRFHQCETKHYALAKSCLLIWECPLRSFTAVHNFVRYWILNMMCGGFNCSKNTLVVLNIIYIVSDVAVSFVTVTLVKYTAQLCVRFLGVNYIVCVWQIFCAQYVCDVADRHTGGHQFCVSWIGLLLPKYMFLPGMKTCELCYQTQWELFWLSDCGLCQFVVVQQTRCVHSYLHFSVMTGDCRNW